MPSEKIIRATITVDLPYDNETLNHGNILNKKIKDVLSQQNFNCKVVAGYLNDNIAMPIMKSAELKKP